MSDIDKTIEKIRLFMAKNKWTPYKMCLQAGLNRNTLYSMNNPDWTPSITTIKKIETVIKKHKGK